MVARLCTRKVARLRALRKGGQLFLCTDLITKPQKTRSKIQLGEESFKKIIEQLDDVLIGELAKAMPPERAMDHKIQIILGSIPPAKVPYRISATQLEELKRKLQELQTCGFIRRSKSPYGALVIFVAKKDNNKACVWIIDHSIRLQ